MFIPDAEILDDSLVPSLTRRDPFFRYLDSLKHDSSSLSQRHIRTSQISRKRDGSGMKVAFCQQIA